MKPKGKKVVGKNFVEADEKYDGKDKTYRGSQADIKEVGERLNKSEKEQGYSKKPRVKPQKKVQKPVSGQKKINY
jgi:hypothetical protein